MAKPNQFLDKNTYISGFYALVEGSAQTVTDAATTVFDADDYTAVLITSSAGCTFSTGSAPAAGEHVIPANVVYPLIVPAGDKIYIAGTAVISTVA
jgi:hypothetical protein